MTAPLDSVTLEIWRVEALRMHGNALNETKHADKAGLISPRELTIASLRITALICEIDRLKGAEPGAFVISDKTERAVLSAALLHYRETLASVTIHELPGLVPEYQRITWALLERNEPSTLKPLSFVEDRTLEQRIADGDCEHTGERSIDRATGTETCLDCGAEIGWQLPPVLERDV